MWNMTFEKSLRMFWPPKTSEAEREANKRIAKDINECMRLMKQIQAELDRRAQQQKEQP